LSKGLLGGVRPFFPAGRACPELAEGGWG